MRSVKKDFHTLKHQQNKSLRTQSTTGKQEQPKSVKGFHKNRINDQQVISAVMYF